MQTPNIQPAISELSEQIVAWRRHFHQHPELGFEEIETGKYIMEQLSGLDASVQYPIGETGIVYTMKNGQGPCIAFRADMDALPLTETTDVPYKSVNEGAMHACGHDSHMAMLMGLLTALDSNRHLWQGTVRGIFQPAEEGLGGAEKMIAEGCLKNPDVEAIFGAHVWNYQVSGTIGVQSGPVMAAADEFTIIVEGTGGHGATPEGTVDAIYVASQLVTNIHSIVSRNVNPLEPAAISICKIEAGTAFNILPKIATLLGTARAYSEEVRLLQKRRLAELCAGIGKAYGATITMDYVDGYPPTVNDEAMTAVVESAAKKVMGDGVGPPYLSMGGEDMSYYLREIPGSFFFIGSAKPDQEPRSAPHHSPHFDIDESVMEVGASIFMQIVEDRLKPNP